MLNGIDSKAFFSEVCIKFGLCFSETKQADFLNRSPRTVEETVQLLFELEGLDFAPSNKGLENKLKSCVLKYMSV